MASELFYVANQSRQRAQEEGGFDDMKHFITTLLLLACSAVALASDPYEPPRVANGKPDFNGVWQVLNTANYDLEPHGAQAAMAFREGPVVPVPAKEVVALGAVGAVPAGLGVVRGGANEPSRSPSRSKNFTSRSPLVSAT